MSEAPAPRVRVVVADDEPLARQRLLMLLALEDWVEVVAECHDGPSTKAAIETLRPDLMFLDVQMPGASGFEVIETIRPDRRPFVIFVTAFDNYALRAFDVHALDYLLKPFDRDRFRKALSRARDQLERRSSGDIEKHLLDLMQGRKSSPTRSTASSSRRAGASSSCGLPRSSGSKRPETTSSCTSARRRTCSAKR